MLTAMGEAVDTEISDCKMIPHDGVLQEETHVYNNLIEGYEEFLEGKTLPAAEAEKQVLEAKGWA